MRRRIIALGAVAFLASAASAQTPQTQNPIDQPTLSEKLDRSDGVIAPPPTGDAEMTQSPPSSAGRMPVIKPGDIQTPETPPGAPKPEAK